MKSWGTFKLAVAITAVGAIWAALAGSAIAAPTSIPGNPMTIDVGPQGQLQAFITGGEDGIYYSPQEQLGDAGFFLALPEKEQVWGFSGSADALQGLETYGEVAQEPVTGSGTAADPFTQVTEYVADEAASGEGVYITDTTTYVEGRTQFTNKWVVTNKSGAPVKFRALAAADFYFEGDDRGTGVFTQGPPRFIGGTNVDSGRSGGFVEVSDGVSPAWSHYQELRYPDVWTEVVERAAEAPIPAHFNDTVEAEDVDNAGGVEWDQYEEEALGDGESATFELIARVGIPAALRLDPTNAGAPQRVPISTTATSLDSNGKPYAGQTLQFSIAGANPLAGAAVLNAAGQAVIVDPGTNAGGDTITAFVDFNKDGIREPAEPQASALATFVDSVAPFCKVKVKGDRPGGGGGAGNKLVITVNCNETAKVSVRGTFRVTGPPLPIRRHHHPPHHRTPRRAAAPVTLGRGVTERKGGGRKARTVKLPVTTHTVQPGAAVPIGVKVPKKIARRFAGRTLVARIVATVSDSAGNVSHATNTRKIKLAKLKKPRHAKRGKQGGQGRGGR